MRHRTGYTQTDNSGLTMKTSVAKQPDVRFQSVPDEVLLDILDSNVATAIETSSTVADHTNMQLHIYGVMRNPDGTLFRYTETMGILGNGSELYDSLRRRGISETGSLQLLQFRDSRLGEVGIEIRANRRQ